MSDDKPSSPKTLKLARRAAPAEPQTGQRGEGARKRSGARARQVAQMERARDKAQHRDAGEDTSRQEPRSAGRRAPMSPSISGAMRTPTSRPASERPRTRIERPAQADDADLAYDAGIANIDDDTDADARSLRGAAAGQDRPARMSRRSRRVLGPAETFAVFAPCPQGLEAALAAELEALGFEDVQPARAGAHFTADWPGVQRANLYSRLATRVLVQVAQAPVSREDDILELARSTEWERWFGPEHRLRVDTSAIKSPMKSLQYCNLRAKDGICDRLREREGARPDIDTVRPDARVHLFLSADTATLYLDTSGESLFKRGWRLDKGEAPLRENLAAGLLALAGWDPSAALVDPFCGSGTLLIEAAWIALGVPAGIARPFGFERLRDHDDRRWRDLKDDARARILPHLDAPLVGVDSDPAAIAAAQQNAERALLAPDTLRLEVGDARRLQAPAPEGWIVTNPPYGERLASEDETLWRDWATCLKRNFAGWRVAVISSDKSLPQAMRLQAHRRTPVYNGALDCRLFQFKLVEASYRP